MKSILPAAAALLAFLPAFHPQEKVKLVRRESQGDKCKVSSTMSIVGKILTTVDGQESSKEIRHLEVSNYVSEILDIGPGLRTERRTYGECTTSDLAPGATEPTQTKTLLSGKAIDFKEVGGKTEIEGAEDVPAADLEEATQKGNFQDASMPVGPVEAGTTWEVDDLTKCLGLPKELAEGASTFKVKGTFEKIEEVGGARCAVISHRMTVKGRFKGIQTDFQGQSHQWLTLDAGRIIKMTAEGTFDFSGDQERGASKVKVGGRIVMKEETVRKYE